MFAAKTQCFQIEINDDAREGNSDSLGTGYHKPVDPNQREFNIPVLGVRLRVDF